ncbi:MAG: hypothetical protein ACTSUE_03720 [Promethearchaeota archaeon]
MANDSDNYYLKSTRHRTVKQPDFDPDAPRLGRRESEPHSEEITYLIDVLRTNFPDDRSFWDLHHYMSPEPGEDYDLCFDISFFKDFQVKDMMRSYKATEFKNRVPTMVINILSTSTWAVDLSDHMDACRLLHIPLYIVFPPYHVASKRYMPPFLRVYLLEEDGTYKIHELKQYIASEDENTLVLDGEKCKDRAFIIDTSPVVPFRLGLMERNKKVRGDTNLACRLILVHQTEPRILPTRVEIVKKQAEQEKQRAEQEKQRADDLEARLKKFKDKFGNVF